jgi:hypothetical protein
MFSAAKAANYAAISTSQIVLLVPVSTHSSSGA